MNFVGVANNFLEAIQICWRKYFVIRFRARRSEFWYWILFTYLAGFVFDSVDRILSAGIGVVSDKPFNIGILGILFSLVTLIPTICVAIRRLHDIDKSGSWAVLFIIPIVGWILLIVLLCTKGTPGPNRFGPDPLL